jgi:hypothetical protein
MGTMDQTHQPDTGQKVTRPGDVPTRSEPADPRAQIGAIAVVTRLIG